MILGKPTNLFPSQVNSWGWKLFGLLLLTFIVLCLPVRTAWAQETSSAEVDPSLLDPPSNECPTQVEVSLFVIDIVDVDEPNEEFALDTYLTISWTDERLASDEDKKYLNDAAQAELGKMWRPNVQFNNQVGRKIVLCSMLAISNEGRVTYDERFQMNLYSPLDLSKFPFDKQKLKIEIEPFGWDTRFVKLDIAEKDSEKLILFYNDDLHMSEWHIADEIECEVKETISKGTGLRYTTIFIDIDAKRKSGFHIWKIFLPLILVLTISWSVFWIATESVGSRLGVAVIAFLAAVSYGFFVNDNLPKISYLTFMDGFIIGIYAFVTLTVIGLLSMHMLYQMGKQTLSLRLNYIFRWAFPLAFAFYVMSILPIF